MDISVIISKAKTIKSSAKALSYVQAQFNRCTARGHRTALISGWDAAFPDEKGGIVTGIQLPPMRQLAMALNATEFQVKQAMEIVKRTGSRGVIVAAKEVIEKKPPRETPPPEREGTAPGGSCGYLIPSTGESCKNQARSEHLTCAHHKRFEEEIRSTKEMLNESEEALPSNGAKT